MNYYGLLETGPYYSHLSDKSDGDKKVYLKNDTSGKHETNTIWVASTCSIGINNNIATDVFTDVTDDLQMGPKTTATDGGQFAEMADKCGSWIQKIFHVAFYK